MRVGADGNYQRPTVMCRFMLAGRRSLLWLLQAAALFISRSAQFCPRTAIVGADRCW
jgi:hypothetical protein